MTTTTTVLVTGNTYPVKDQIKALGGRWDANAKGWRVPADKADEAQKLVAGAPTATRKAYDGRICRNCGHRERRNARGYVQGDWVRGGVCQS